MIWYDGTGEGDGLSYSEVSKVSDTMVISLCSALSLRIMMMINVLPGLGYFQF